ncbi:MAG: hypothetical protein CM15mP117_06710 [Alphaproteobacteria bacterium]|nr:MAG: hypothetical protein CM15mP117_06710 [Alphaproteobacteria bacterium]
MIDLHLQICRSCLPVTDKSIPDDYDCKIFKLFESRTNANIISSPCLGVCTSPVSLTLQSPNRTTYVFKNVDLKKDQEDLIATCKLYLAADDGWIEDATGCGTFRHLLHAKIPPI